VEAEPFTYNVDFQSQYSAQLRTLVTQEEWISCTPHDALFSCYVELPLGHESVIRRIHIGNSSSELTSVIDLQNPGGNTRVALSSYQEGRVTPSYLIPLPDAGYIFSQLEFLDGTRGEITTLGAINPTDSTFTFVSDSDEAPLLLATLHGGRYTYNDGGDWTLHPIVGGEVTKVIWTIHEGGVNQVARESGFFTVPYEPGANLGVMEALTGRQAPDVRVTYTYAGGQEKTYSYHADWEAWISKGVLLALEFDELIACSGSGSTSYGESVIVAECRLNSDESPEKLFKDILWGFAPDQLKSLETPDIESVMKRFDVIQDAAYAEDLAKAENRLSELSILNKKADHRFIFRNGLERSFRYWKDSARNRVVLPVVDDVNAVYFKYILVDGSESPVIREALRR
jgi:hypothetical protein